LIPVISTVVGACISCERLIPLLEVVTVVNTTASANGYNDWWEENLSVGASEESGEEEDHHGHAHGEEL